MTSVFKLLCRLETAVGLQVLLLATGTKAAGRKFTIYFADRKKITTWKYKLVIFWTIIAKHRENSTTNTALETALGKILKYLRETTGGGEVAQPFLHGRLRPMVRCQFFWLRISQNTS